MLAVLRRRWIASAAWSSVALGPFYTSWYVIWGLPFAIASRRYLAWFVMSLPFVGAIMFSPFTRLFSPGTIAPCVVAAAVAETWRLGMRRQARLAAAAS